MLPCFLNSVSPFSISSIENLPHHLIKLLRAIHIRFVEEVIHVIHCPVQLYKILLQILCIYHDKRLLKPQEHQSVAPVKALR